MAISKRKSAPKERKASESLSKDLKVQFMGFIEKALKKSEKKLSALEKVVHKLKESASKKSATKGKPSVKGKAKKKGSADKSRLAKKQKAEMAI